MTELERLLAAALKRLDEQHSASVDSLSASGALLNGRQAESERRIDALLTAFEGLATEFEKLASQQERLETDVTSIVRKLTPR